MNFQTDTTGSHLKSRPTSRRKSSPLKTSPQCWLWNAPGIPERILFVDETRNKNFAVYFVDDMWYTDRGQKKRRFAKLPSQGLRGAMQIALDEFAKERDLEPCGPQTWDSVQNSLKKGTNR